MHSYLQKKVFSKINQLAKWCCMAVPTSGLNNSCNRFHSLENPNLKNETGTKQKNST